MRALLDVNVLIALLDGAHADHRRARDWLSEHIRDGWASCPMTQNGLVRILSQPAYPGSVTPAAAMQRLSAATATEHHEFWSDEFSILDRNRVDPVAIHGHRQVTDAYLLALALAHGGVFVTLDERITIRAVPGAEPRHLVVI